jgi:hypothetical protein
MQHSPSWQANRSSISQEIPRILWNPEIKYLIHEIPPSAPKLETKKPETPKFCKASYTSKMCPCAIHPFFPQFVLRQIHSLHSVRSTAFSFNIQYLSFS